MWNCAQEGGSTWTRVHGTLASCPQRCCHYPPPAANAEHVGVSRDSVRSWSALPEVTRPAGGRAGPLPVWPPLLSWGSGSQGTPAGCQQLPRAWVQSGRGSEGLSGPRRCRGPGSQGRKPGSGLAGWALSDPGLRSPCTWPLGGSIPSFSGVQRSGGCQRRGKAHPLPLPSPAV